MQFKQLRHVIIGCQISHVLPWGGTWLSPGQTISLKKNVFLKRINQYKKFWCIRRIT